MKNNTATIDLHCHLDGSLSPGCIRALAKTAGITLPDSEEGLRSCLQVEPGCRSLKEYLEKFGLPLSCLISEESFETAAYDVMAQGAGEHTIYMEIRFAPLLSAAEGLSSRQIVESVLRGLKKAEESFQIKGNIILCAMRHMPWEKNMEIVELAREYLGQGVCAIDLAGDEAAFPVLGQKRVFEEAARLGIPFTIHAGECSSAESIQNAVELGAKRIGHGIAMAGNKDAIRLCRQREIGIEMCPTSNLQTKAVPSMGQYPFREFWEEGLLVTVNTDNRTVSGTTVTQELEALEQAGYLLPEERKQLMQNAAKASFANNAVKDWMLEKIG